MSDNVRLEECEWINICALFTAARHRHSCNRLHCCVILLPETSVLGLYLRADCCVIIYSFRVHRPVRRFCTSYRCEENWTKWRSDRFVCQYFGFPLSVSFHQCCTLTHFHLHVTLNRRKSGEALEPSKKQCSFVNRELGRKMSSQLTLSARNLVIKCAD